MDGQKAQWTEQFEELYTVNPSSGEIEKDVLQAVNTEPPIDKTSLALDKVSVPLARF